MGLVQRSLLPARALALVVALLPALPTAAEPRLLFGADFDAAMPCQAGSVAGRGGSGAALRLEPGGECSFAADGKLRPEAGTLSFWVQPLDWSDEKAIPQLLFEWSGRAGGEPFQLSVSRPFEPGLVRASVAFGAFGDRHQRLFQIVAPVEWRAGVWTKLDLTWQRGEFVLYANGRAGERMTLVSEALPTGGRIRLMPGAGPGQPSPATALDALEVWDGALPGDRVARRLRAETLPPLAPARLTAPRLAAPPALDGRLEGAWSSATRVPLLADAETGCAGLLVPHASFGWSERALHVALEAPLTDPKDAFELALVPAGGGAPQTLRIGPAGLAPAARASGGAGAARSEPERWSAELEVPWAALGVAPRAGGSLGLELRHRPARPGALGVGAMLAGTLVLGGAADGVRVRAAPTLASEGRLAFALERDADTRASLELEAADGKRTRERERFEGRSELVLERAPAEGVLRLAVEDADAGPLLELAARSAPLEPPGFVVVPDTKERSLVAELDLGWLDGRWLGALAAGRARARLADHGPKGTEGPVDVALQDARGKVRLASGLAPGVHRLVLELASADETLPLSRPVDVPPLPWLGTRRGESEEVLEPWLPLGYDADGGVRVWGRRYVFEGPLLRAVDGRGGPMLRGPMELRLRGAAGASKLVVRSSEPPGQSPARMELRGTGSFPGAGIDVSWSSALEYDGLVVTRLTLEPKPNAARVDELVLELPLAARYAKYLRGTQHGSMLWRGRVPWDGRRFESRFEPFLWLTDEREGFLWFSESPANWVAAEQPGAVQVRGGPEAGFTLRLIGAPTALPGPVTYVFGLQATPVKPMLPDARAWNFGVGGTPTPHERAIGHYDGWAVADGLLETAHPEALAAIDAKLEEQRGVRPFYYGITSATADFHPVFKLFALLWRSAWSVAYPGGPWPATELRDAIPRHRVVGVCPIDPDWQERLLFDADRLLHEVRALGIYLDTDEVFADDNPRHGCGTTDAFGRRHATFGFLGKRRFAKRLATLVREAGGGRRYWMSHAHTRLVPPVTGFADFWLPGEELTGLVSKNPEFYVDGLDETSWRVEYRGESSGIVHVLLPQLERAAGRTAVAGPSHTEGLLAMAAVNDVNVSSAFTHLATTGEYWGLRERLGLVGAEFTGHWAPDVPVRALAPDARASLYRTTQGPVLVVGSRSAHTPAVEVQLDEAALGLRPGFVAKDERSGRTLERRGDRVTVPLGAHRYTFISLR